VGRSIARSAAVLLVAVTASACSGGDGSTIERTEWLLAETSNNRTLELYVYAGGSSCVDYDRVEVAATPDDVTVAAYVRWSGPGCSEDFRWEEVPVELDEPLGERDLTGCTGEEITVTGWNLDPETDCGDVPDWISEQLKFSTPAPSR